jgi:endonuclease III
MTAREKQKALIAEVLKQGHALLNAPRAPIDFKTGMPDAERSLNSIEKFPHLYVLGCIMDRQIPFGRAWAIPYRVGLAVGGMDFPAFQKVTQRETELIFAEGKLHRFNKVAANHFYRAVRRIDDLYEGDAAKIWLGTPSSASVIRRFLEFEGVGIKIATMAANILVREFKMPMSDCSAIDISPDSRVTRFFKENGFLRPEASAIELIYLARELSPEFPGLLDYGAFLAGEYKRGRDRT